MAERACVIWGSSGHARVLRDMLQGQGVPLAALVDRDPAARPVAEGVPLLAGEAALRAFLGAWQGAPLEGYVAVGGPHGAGRRAILDLFAACGLATPPLIHPRAFIAPSARTGAGSHVMALAALAADAVIGRGCILNHGAVADHECTLADGVHIAPNATLCGCVQVGQDAFVGAGATVLPRLHIGAGSVIGAGAVVTRDVAPGVVVTGSPAAQRLR